MPGCEELADCEVSGPLGFASEIIVAAKLVRLLLSPFSNPAWVDRSVCWFCQAVSGPVSRLRIAFTTDLTSMPFPFSKAAALKLIPICFSSLPSRPGPEPRPEVELFLSQQFVAAIPGSGGCRESCWALAGPAHPIACLRL